MNVEVTYNMEALRRSCLLYGRLSGKTEAEVVAKQSSKLSWNIWRGLSAVTPGKQEIMSSAESVLASGGMIRVRPAAYASVMDRHGESWAAGETQFGKDELTVQQLAVQREIGMRIAGRGFLAFSTPRPQGALSGESSYKREMDSRYGFKLSDFDLAVQELAERQRATLTWFGAKGQYQSPIPGLSKEQQRTVIVEAIRETTDDINIYVTRKLREDAERSGLNPF